MVCYMAPSCSFMWYYFSNHAFLPALKKKVILNTSLRSLLYAVNILKTSLRRHCVFWKKERWMKTFCFYRYDVNCTFWMSKRCHRNIIECNGILFEESQWLLWLFWSIFQVSSLLSFGISFRPSPLSHCDFFLIRDFFFQPK